MILRYYDNYGKAKFTTWYPIRIVPQMRRELCIADCQGVGPVSYRYGIHPPGSFDERREIKQEVYE